MKKLLSLLSVLTISGTAIPTTIAASPYQKKETIKNSDINNLKILNRNKRENTYISDIYMLTDGEINLNVPSIEQSERLSCGPAVATSILRYFGLSNLQITNETPYICERRLINNMQTDDGSPYSALPGGTTVQNWVNSVNGYIRQNGLNNLRQYTSLRLHNSILDSNINRVNTVFDYSNHYLGISRIIYNSLINNMPVPLGFTGRFNTFENNRSHFILIYGISINSSNNIIFRYMDPDGGRRNSITTNQLNSLLINGGYLIYHDPNSQLQSETQIPRPNQTEPMDFSGQNKGYIYNFLTSCLAFHSLNNYRKIRSNPNDNQYYQNSTIDSKKITIWKTLDENTKGGSLQSGDTYIGTTSRVYLLFKRGNEINLKKFNDLDFLVKDIKLDGNGSAYIEKDKNNGIVYHLNLQGLGHTEVNLNSLWQWGGDKNLPFPYNNK